MNQFKFWNQVCGWITFIVAAFTYLSTMEPTASFGIALSLLQQLLSWMSVILQALLSSCFWAISLRYLHRMSRKWQDGE